MTSDEREARNARIRYLSGQGWSVRQIAREEGMSRSQVHRVLMAAAEEEPADDGSPDPWDDEDDAAEALSLYDAPEEEPAPVPPFTFVGRARVRLYRGKGDEPGWGTEERWVDGRGVPLGASGPLILYRYRQALRERGDYAGARRLREDMARQVEEYDARARR